MTTYFEITDKELRGVYELLTKEQLIEALIRKHKECRDIAKNCVTPAVVGRSEQFVCLCPRTKEDNCDRKEPCKECETCPHFRQTNCN